MDTLTPKQRQILDAIRSHIRSTGQSPTIREIGAAVNLRSSCSVQKQIETLERAGVITRSSFKYRSIEVVGDSAAVATETTLYPIPILGLVAGGAPIEAQQEIDPEILSLPSSLLPRFDEIRQLNSCNLQKFFEAPLFAFKVSGKSMINAGIDDGDTLVVRRQADAQNGEIVVALVDGEDATVKRYYREKDRIRLQPENDDFSPIYSDDVRIFGKVALSIKRF